MLNGVMKRKQLIKHWKFERNLPERIGFSVHCSNFLSISRAPTARPASAAIEN